MNANVDWVRTLRAIVVAAVLLMALLGAVLASIGVNSPAWLWASDPPATLGATLLHAPVLPPG